MICPCCEQEKESVAKRRRNTMYIDDELNYLESCDKCYEIDCEYYADLWTQYWNDVL